MSIHRPDQEPRIDQVRHSGQTDLPMRERPFNDFDNTTLPEAYDRGLITTPDTAEDLVKPETKRSKSYNRLIATVAGIALLGGGAAVGYNLMNQSAPNTEPIPAAPVDPSDEAPIDAPEVENPEGTTPSIETVISGIDAEIINDPETLSSTFIDNVVNTWQYYGATPENAEIARTSGDLVGTAAQIAAESDQVFIDNYLASDWESNPRLVEWVNGMKETHADSLVIYFKTSNPEITPENIEPYHAWLEQQSVASTEVNPDGSISIQTIEQFKDNRDMNIIGEADNFTINGRFNTDMLTTRTYIVENGKVKINDMVPAQYIE